MTRAPSFAPFAGRGSVTTPRAGRQHRIDNVSQPLLATPKFTGLRLGELLGLRLSDVDRQAGVIQVRRQAYRTGKTAPLKTTKATRTVLLTPALSQLLRQHRLRSAHSLADNFVFAPSGWPTYAPDVIRTCGLHTAVKRTSLDQPDKPRFRFHDLRHTYASLLIAQGVNVAFVSRQLGHASITTTLNVYTHLFDHAEHAASVIGRLEDSFGDVLRPAGARKVY